MFPKYSNLFLLAELIGFAWFSYTYGGVLFLYLFSTLLSIFRSRPAPAVCLLWSSIGLAALLSGLHGRDNEIIFAAAVLWATTAAILYASNEFEDKRHRIEDLYEALAASHVELDAAKRRMQEKTVHEGSVLIHPDIARKLAGMLETPRADTVKSVTVTGLTQAEGQIVRLIADGQSNKEIAASMFLSEGTVKNYISEILNKLELRDRTQIAIFYLKLLHQ